jgi:hypothetical protein
MILFMVALIGCDMLIPAPAFSAYENRLMTSRPQLKTHSIMNGDFQHRYEDFINDQFIARPLWVQLQTAINQSLGRFEKNGVVIGQSDYLFNHLWRLDPRFESNLTALKTFLDQYPHAKAMIALNSYAVDAEFLRYRELWIDPLEALYPPHLQWISVTPFLESDQALYYKSDHHWNLRGAHLAASLISKSIHIELPAYEEYNITEVEGFLGSYYRRLLPVFYPKETFYYLNMSLDYHLNGEIHETLFDESALSSNDYYRGFLHGNHGFAQIFNPDASKKILFIKDSYANSVIPFIAPFFGQTDIIDLRFFNGSLKTLIEEEGYDHIIFLENFDQFQSQRHLFKLHQ